MEITIFRESEKPRFGVFCHCSKLRKYRAVQSARCFQVSMSKPVNIQEKFWIGRCSSRGYVAGVFCKLHDSALPLGWEMGNLTPGRRRSNEHSKKTDRCIHELDSESGFCFFVTTVFGEKFMKTFDREFKAKARLCWERCQRQMGEPNKAVWSPDCAFGDARAVWCWVSLGFSLKMCFWSSPLSLLLRAHGGKRLFSPSAPSIDKEGNKSTAGRLTVNDGEFSRKWRA